MVIDQAIAPVVVVALTVIVVTGLVCGSWVIVSITRILRGEK